MPVETKDRAIQRGAFRLDCLVKVPEVLCWKRLRRANMYLELTPDISCKEPFSSPWANRTFPGF